MINKTLRSLLSGLILLVLVISSIGEVLASEAVVKIDPATASLNVGQTTEVTVKVENVTGLFGVELRLQFDPSVVEVVDAKPDANGIQVAPGDFLLPDFEAINLVHEGTIDYAVTQVAPHNPVDGSGTLVKITFRGKAPGSTNVQLTTVLLSNENGEGISNSTMDGYITVGGVAPTATPVVPTPTPGPTNTPAPTPTSGPTPTPGPTATPGPTPTPYYPPSQWNCTNIQGYHVIRPKETLYSIGRAYTTHPSAIAACNNIVNPNRVPAGLRLAIPYAPWGAVPPGPVAEQQFTPGGGITPPPPPTGCRYMHTVQPRETLTQLSLRYGVSIWTIARANNIYNINLIYAGQQLCIP